MQTKTSMIYAIGILSNAIKDHIKIINQLNDTDTELISDDFFRQEEIKEREHYISILQQAIKKLTS